MISSEQEVSIPSLEYAEQIFLFTTYDPTDTVFLGDVSVFNFIINLIFGEI